MSDMQNSNQNSPQPSNPYSGQPVPAEPETGAKGTSGMAIAGLVLGIVAICGSFVPIVNNVSFFIGLVGLVLAIAGLAGIRKGKAGGTGIAVAGIVLGIVSIVVVLATQAAFSAAISSLLGRGGSSEATAPASESEVREVAEAAPPKYAVTIDGAIAGPDYQGNPAIVVTYSWQNNSDRATSFAAAVYPKCFQNGVELNSAFVLEGMDSSGYLAEVKPGSGTTVQLAYSLTDESPVEVEVTELFDFAGEPIARATFNVA